jgi:sarcosine oxidase subunit gamma
VADDYLRQSPLAHLGLEGRAAEDRGAAGVAMGERAFPGILDLRGRLETLSPAFETAFGFALPARINSAADNGKTGAKARLEALRLGPDEWWLLGAEPAKLAAKLAKALDGRPAAVTEVSESRTCIRVAGPRARDLLAKGSPLDLHPRVFQPGACAQGQLAKATVLIHQVDDEPAYDVYVLRSFAEYLWLWLEDAAGEYGMAVVAG